VNNENLVCNPDRDIIFVPFSPISETDKFEVRAQIQNSGKSSKINVEIYLDIVDEANLLWRGKNFAEKGRYAFVQCFPDIVDKAGVHNIIIRFSADGLKWQTVSKDFEVRKYTPNLIEGAFIMFGATDKKTCSSFSNVKDLTDSQWKEQMDSFDELGFKTIIPLAIIQLEHYSERFSANVEKEFRAHYPSRIYPTFDMKSEDPVKIILETAEKNGQKVILPFGNNYTLCERRLELMEEIWERYGKYKSFYGWYQALEPHLNLSVDVFQEFFELLEEDRKKADELCPAKPILLSVACSAPAISDAIFHILKQGAFKADIIAPMDILGCTRGRPEQLKLNSRSFSALKEALKDTKTHFWGNCESFDIDGEGIIVPRYLNGGFDGHAGFVQQMETARPYCEKLITFEATGIFAKPGLKPEIGGEKAVEQYQRYADYMKHPAIAYKNIALGRQYTKSKYPDFPNWHPSSFWTRKKLIIDKNHLSSDGYIAGGRQEERADLSKIYGYAIFDEPVYLELLFDLEKQEKIDMLRVADAPPFLGQFDNPDTSPDKIIVEAGNDLNKMKNIGECCKYVHGWASIVLPETLSCRYVKFSFSKKKNTAFKKSAMLINEIEICQKYEE